MCMCVHAHVGGKGYTEILTKKILYPGEI